MTHLVTGAGSGIGAAVVEQLDRRGEDVLLLARSATRAAELQVRYPRAEIVTADLADPASIDDLSLPASLASIVHAAGVVNIGRIEEIPTASWTEQLAVNLVSPVSLTRRALPALRHGQGTAVFINSVAGLTGYPNWSAYGASKHGLRAFADSLRAEELATGVRVTSIYPGRTATPMQERVHGQEGLAYAPGDWIRPQSVASTILAAIFLSPDASLTDISIEPGLAGRSG